MIQGRKKNEIETQALMASATDAVFGSLPSNAS